MEFKRELTLKQNKEWSINQIKIDREQNWGCVI